MATNKWALRVSDQANNASPIVANNVPRSTSEIISRLDKFRSGNVKSVVRVETSYDQAPATGTLTFGDTITGGDVLGVTINGVDCTATYATSINNTAMLVKHQVNEGGNTPNALVSKAVYANRTFTDGTGTFTFAGVAAGAAAVTVGGTACNFTAVGNNTTDAKACAAAINAQGVAGLKVFATSSGAVCTVTAQSAPRGTFTIASGDADDVFYAVIDGVTVSATFDTSDTVTAAALATAINASPALLGKVRANSAAGVVSVISRTTGDLVPALGVTGTGVTIGGTADPSATIVVSTASGAVVVYVNGHPISFTLPTGGSDAVDAAYIASKINDDPYARSLGFASSSSGTVTYTANSAIRIRSYASAGATGTITAAGTTASDGSTVLTGAGLWGGVAGNAVTTSTATAGITAGAATVANGATTLTYTATQPGVSGNWITSAAAGAAAAKVTASGARLTGGSETIFPIQYPI